jgi:RNA polymerase sigma factor (sigma-70 family)
VDNDERAIYAWINPDKAPEDAKRERYRMVLLQAIRYGLHHCADDIWQEWQLAVHQRAQAPPPVPVAEREVFSFGIARNLCRATLRKEQRTIPLSVSSNAEDGDKGIREEDLEQRRADRPSLPINKLPESQESPGWDDDAGLKHCIQRLRPRTQELLRRTYLDGLSSAEAGAATGLSAENVRQQLSRARDELRRCLAARAGQGTRKRWSHADVHE